MPPRTASQPNSKGTGKTKSQKEHQQVSQIEFGLPTATVVALQSISSRATQDLWASTAFQSEGLTAEQLAQRRTNATGKLTKRIVGNVKAKEDLTLAVQTWFNHISQHLLGLMGRMRAIGSKLDEDLSSAIQEMQGYLAEQPSAATSAQIAHATQQMGPIWSVVQEQEVVRLAAMLRAFGQVVLPPPPAPVPQQAGELVPATSLSNTMREPSELGSDFSFGHDLAPRPVSVLANPGVATAEAPVAGPRWQKRRSALTAGRPSKSLRREPTTIPSPWTAPATGRTPEGLPRQSQTEILEDVPVLDDGAPKAATTWQPWSYYWLQLLDFAVCNGNDPIGDLARDPAQDASFPLPVEEQDSAVAMEHAQQTWAALQRTVHQKDLSAASSLCHALHQALLLLRSAPSILSVVPQGLLLAAHVTQGALLDPYSYAPATAQEWLYPTLLVEQGSPLKGYIAAQASSVPEVQGPLLQACPYFNAEAQDVQDTVSQDEELVPAAST